MSNLTPKLAPKSTSKLARPTGLAQARASPTPTASRPQGAHEKSYRGAGLVVDSYAIKPPNKHMSGAVVDGQADSTVPVDDFRIGERVWVAGLKPGIIAFIGEVQFGPGEWAGVVLDSPVGKNDGSVNGVRYFMCEPKRGIFSRLTKLSRTPTPKLGSPAPSDKSDDGIPKSSSTPSSGKTAKTAEERTPNGEGSIPTPKSSLPSALPRRLSVGSHSSQGQVSPSSGSVTDIPAVGHKFMYKVGDRVTVSGSKTGVIRYLGEADFAKGTWVGVELDEPLGKNDGSVAGKRYFTCSPMFGLFAPFHKVELYQTYASRVNLEAAPSALRRGSLQKLGYSDGMSRDRTGSQESISSIGSAASSASRSGRMRLGITSLAAQGSKTRAAVYGTTPTVSALQKSLKEKEEHVEQLLRERDVERADFIRTASQIEELETQLSMKQAEHTKFVHEMEETMRRLKSSLEKVEEEKADVFHQLMDEKRKVEDLQFTIEEAAIDKGDIETQMEKYRHRMKELEASLKIAKEQTGKQKPISALLADEAEEEDYLDQIEELTHKLFVAENQIKAMQQGNQMPLDQCSSELCANCGKAVVTSNGQKMAKGDSSIQSTDQLKAEVAKLMQEKKATESEVNSVREELQLRTADRETLQKQVTELSSDRDRLRLKTDELSRENASLKNLMHEMDARTKDFKSQVEKLKMEHETVVKDMQRRIQQEMKSNREQASQRLKDLEKENVHLKSTVDQLKEGIKTKDESTQQPQKSTSEGGKTASSLTEKVATQEMKLLQQRVRQLEKALSDSQTNANVVNNISTSPTSTDSVKLKSDKDSDEAQIDFLKSVIVEIQRKNVDLEARLQAMDPTVTLTSSSSLTNSLIDGYNTNGADVRQVAPRLFCDICDVFDLHDTDDCPKQDMSNSPPASHHHGNRKEDRPYCTTCEVFGHSSDQCTDEQTF